MHAIDSLSNDPLQQTNSYKFPRALKNMFAGRIWKLRINKIKIKDKFNAIAIEIINVYNSSNSGSALNHSVAPALIEAAEPRFQQYKLLIKPHWSPAEDQCLLEIIENNKFPNQKNISNLYMFHYYSNNEAKKISPKTDREIYKRIDVISHPLYLPHSSIPEYIPTEVINNFVKNIWEEKYKNHYLNLKEIAKNYVQESSIDHLIQQSASRVNPFVKKIRFSWTVDLVAYLSQITYQDINRAIKKPNYLRYRFAAIHYSKPSAKKLALPHYSFIISKIEEISLRQLDQIAQEKNTKDPIFSELDFRYYYFLKEIEKDPELLNPPNPFIWENTEQPSAETLFDL